MSTGPFPPPLPFDADGDPHEDAPLREEDGEEVLDEDANDDLIDSAEADRIAAEGDDEEEE